MVVLWALAAGATCGHAAPAGQADSADERALAGLRSELEQRARDDAFAGTVLVAHDGRVLFEGAFGRANREEQIDHTLETRLNFGSLGKMFTGVAILQLVQAGKLSLESTVGEHLRDYPDPGVAKVTVHQLLTHTGGTGNTGRGFVGSRDRHRELQDYVELYGQRPLEFEPGTRWEYSNYGFILLGRIVEIVSGQRYDDYVREKIFLPSGMTATDNVEEKIRTGPIATRYARSGPGDTRKKKGPTTSGAGPLSPVGHDEPIGGTSAGGGYSTVGDLFRFTEALRSHRLLDARHTELLTTGKVATQKPGGKYAYGFAEELLEDGVRRIGHTGGAPGVNAVLAIYPRTGHVVAVLANIEGRPPLDVSTFIAEQLPLREAK
jgi:CubicO group peptidase (beta-lactamase class C family)